METGRPPKGKSEIIVTAYNRKTREIINTCVFDEMDKALFFISSMLIQDYDRAEAKDLNWVYDYKVQVVRKEV